MADHTVSYPGKSVYDNCTHITGSGFDILIAKKDFSVATVSGTQQVKADSRLQDLGTANGYSLKQYPNGSKMDVNNDGKPDTIFATQDGELFAILAK